LLGLLTLGLLAIGCSRQPSSVANSRSLKEHAGELKKQHQREMQNR
jgi:hypothetical protein